MSETATDTRTGWLAATCYPVGTLDDYSWSYSWDGQLHSTRKAAIKAGLKGFGSDDFNVGHVQNGALDWWGWMDEEHPDDLASAAEGLYLTCRPTTRTDRTLDGDRDAL